MAEDAFAQVNNTGYVGAFQYNDEGLDFTSTGEGRIVTETNGESDYRFEYSIKDHLGSLRR